MATTNHDTGGDDDGPHLLKLSAELRNKIYDYALSDTPNTIRVSEFGFEVAGLLLANRQIRSETRAMYYSNHVFVIPLVEKFRLHAKFQDATADLEQSTIRVRFDAPRWVPPSSGGMGTGKSCYPSALYDLYMESSLSRMRRERAEEHEKWFFHARRLYLVEQRIWELELEEAGLRRPARKASEREIQGGGDNFGYHSEDWAR